MLQIPGIGINFFLYLFSPLARLRGCITHFLSSASEGVKAERIVSYFCITRELGEFIVAEFLPLCEDCRF